MINQTQEQQSFIEALSQGHSSITLDAVAGSGKTTTLVLAAQALNPKPSQVLALAFNKKIATELEKRLPKSIDVRTLNGLGHRAWGDFLKRRLTLNNDKLGTICSEVCKELDIGEHWRSLLTLTQKAKEAGLAPNTTQGCIGLMKDEMESWAWLIAQHNIENGEKLISAARKVLSKSILSALGGEIDFSDQLYMPAIFRAPMPQYPIVLVDEAQDLSEIQHELIARVAKHGRLIAVGDPKQAIYGFRGAMSNSMEVLSNKFNSQRLSLSYTFRCPKVLVKMAQEIVSNIKCPDGAENGAFFDLGQDWTPEDLAPNSAILCRNIAPLLKLGIQCFRAGISAHIVGRDIGAALIKAAKELSGSSTKELHDSVRDWQGKKRILANGNMQVMAKADETAEALHFVIEQAKAQSPHEVENQLKKLFSKDNGSITLSTIHRAKGLEWDQVYLLDSWRIPQKFAQVAVENDPEGCAWMLEQEQNLKYIAITRARKKLIFIEYEKGF